MSRVETLSRRWVLGLGANLGDRRKNLHTAIRQVGSHPQVALERVASLYESPPMGPPQPDYLNTAIRIRTNLGPRKLLEFVLQIERAMGRERTERWGPRTIDIDLLDWEGSAIAEDGLTVPHPGLRERAFVWFPYLDVTWRTALEAPPLLERPATVHDRRSSESFLVPFGATPR